MVVLNLSSQQLLQTAVAGVSANIAILCNVGQQDETPFWYINGSVYELFSIPRRFLSGVTPAVIPAVDSYSALTIAAVTRELNGITFRCAVFNENGIVVLGIGSMLNVVVQSKLLHSGSLSPQI